MVATDDVAERHCASRRERSIHGVFMGIWVALQHTERTPGVHDWCVPTAFRDPLATLTPPQPTRITILALLQRTRTHQLNPSAMHNAPVLRPSPSSWPVQALLTTSTSPSVSTGMTSCGGISSGIHRMGVARGGPWGHTASCPWRAQNASAPAGQ